MGPATEAAAVRCRVCGTALRGPAPETCTRCRDRAQAGHLSPWRTPRARRTWAAGVLLGAGLLLRYGGDPGVAPPGLGRTVSAADGFFAAAALLGALTFLGQGVSRLLALLRLRPTPVGIDTLMTLAILGAVAVGEYLEAAGLAFLFSLAELLEAHATYRARRSLRRLLALAPPTARILTPAGAREVPVEEVTPGTLVAVRPGDRIPLDGVVRRGRSAVNQAPITGESLPVDKGPGDPVFAGSLNAEGYLEVEVTRAARDTTLARILHLVEEAEASRAPSQRFVERFARIYTPTVVSLAVAVAVFPPLLAGASFPVWFGRALALLVVACPCALVISTPVSVVSAITAAARQGVLIKGGTPLEDLAHVRLVCLDKTGTLTEGRLEVTDVVPFRGGEEEVLALAAALEGRSAHPVARAVAAAWAARRPAASPAAVTAFRSLTGRGVEGCVGGRRVRVGKPELFGPAETAPIRARREALEGEGKTAVLVGDEEGVLGLVAVADRIRPAAPEVVAALHRLGVEVALLTGDRAGTARAVARAAGIPRCRADLLPADKARAVTEFQERYGPAAMVGDGVNDAPALAAARVGVAMGAAGADAAVETARVALMGDDLTKVPYLLRLGRAARRVITQNISAAIVVKLALGLGVFPGWVTLVTAVLVGDMGMSLLVTANALRLARLRP